MNTDSAAHNLLGLTLNTGWHVTKKISKDDNSTGAFFSVCYEVEKEGKTCFLKAFNFTPFFQLAEQSHSGKTVTDVIGDMIEAYKYERTLSEYCKQGHVTKVVYVIDSGEEILKNFSINIVPYLIFELADGDIRHRLNFSNNLDVAWKLKSLHDIAVGLQQLHNVNISHQDLKPSNILLFNKESKIGDLGRSMCKEIDSQYNKQIYSGDWTYAPPELMYGYYENDWEKRVFATDCYLLGSMVVFYFAGVSMSALMMKYIPEMQRWEKWRGEFAEVKDYLLDAYSNALDEFEACVSETGFKSDLKQIVEYLCFPLPEKRGHPKNNLNTGNKYSLERFVSKLDLLRSRAEYNLIHYGNRN